MENGNNDQLVNAINDLTRVIIALNGGFNSKSQAVRKLSDLSIPSGRIGTILAMTQQDVASIFSKARRNRSK